MIEWLIKYCKSDRFRWFVIFRWLKLIFPPPSYLSWSKENLVGVDSVVLLTCSVGIFVDFLFPPIPSVWSLTLLGNSIRSLSDDLDDFFIFPASFFSTLLLTFLPAFFCASRYKRWRRFIPNDCLFATVPFVEIGFVFNCGPISTRVWKSACGPNLNPYPSLVSNPAIRRD